ncbi:MAG: lipid-A-disaccharide synthase [Planctomycetaceae bacterium]
MRLFLSVGEPSGDQHAAHLIRELDRRAPGSSFTGFGGPEMEAAGFQNLYRLTDIAVMGLGGIPPVLGTFIKQYRRAKEFLRSERPDAVVLVDCPGFNWWIAKAAKKLGIPTLYYLPPQLWAWAPWRIRKVRKWVDVVLAALPFEAEWYSSRGIDVEYVGHPFFDEVAEHPLSQAFLDRCRWGEHGRPVRTVGILPGSRRQEVERNFPVMLEVMQRLSRAHDDVRFRVACYKESQREFCRSQMVGSYATLPADLHVGRTPEIIEASECCLMTSGSVSLELLARTTPAVVQYRGGPLMMAVAKLLVTCKYFSLPSLIAGRAAYPEYPFVGRPSRHAHQIAVQLDEWLSSPAKLAEVRGELRTLQDQAVRTGAVAAAADTILRRLNITQPAAARLKGPPPSVLAGRRSTPASSPAGCFATSRLHRSRSRLRGGRRADAPTAG